MKRLHRVGLAAAICVPFIAAPALAIAVSRGAVTSTIHACTSKSTGAVRIATKCGHSERAVSWNVQGPQGLPGTMGSPGPTGAPGTPATTVTYEYTFSHASSTPSGGTSTSSIPGGSTLVFNGAKSSITGDVSACNAGFNVNVAAPAGLWMNFYSPNGSLSSGSWGALGSVPYVTPSDGAIQWSSTCSTRTDLNAPVPPFTVHFVFDETRPPVPFN